MSLFIYTYACHEDEQSLCQLELRSLFGRDCSDDAISFSSKSAFATEFEIFHSKLKIDPSRSPFLKERIHVMHEANSYTDLSEDIQAADLQLESSETFKVRFIKTNDLPAVDAIDYNEARRIERAIGLHIRGKADMRQPTRVFGIVAYRGRWYFGECADHTSIWLEHIKKPQQYTMALPARTARALVNIAVPDPWLKRVIDPCCGIGTALIEALSMGIDIVGRDINPLVVRGARDNLAHFNLHTEVSLGSISDIDAHYDVAIVDMPYNIVSKISPKDEYAILQHARRIADRVVIISIAPIDDRLESVGFTIQDHGIAKKAAFTRHVRVCT
jgi:tRNA G10  N-methylase Trm11